MMRGVVVELLLTKITDIMIMIGNFSKSLSRDQETLLSLDLPSALIQNWVQSDKENCFKK